MTPSLKHSRSDPPGAHQMITEKQKAALLRPSVLSNRLVAAASSSAAATAAASAAVAAAAATASTSTVSAAASAAAGTAFLGLGFVDGQRAAAVVLAVERGDR